MTASRVPRGRRGGRKKENTQLQQRIARLEGLLKVIEDKTSQGALPITEDNKPSQSHPDRGRGQVSSSRQRDSPASAGSTTGGSSGSTADENMDRYLGTSFWISLSDEVSGLREVFGQSSEDEDEEPENIEHLDPSTSLQPRHSLFFLGGSDSSARESDALQHPSRAQIYALCTIYLDRIDPLFKMIHGPSLSRYMREAKPYLDRPPDDEGVEALAFAVYYAAVTGLSDEECQQQIGDSKQALVARYGLGMEHALARADLVNTTDISTLQALVIFLLCVRCHESRRFTWTLMGLAVRIAHALGLHRDATSASLGPFEKEMRRRLWWQLSLLDAQSAHDRASDPVIFPASFDTPMPLNIEDDDLSFHGKETVHAREGLTPMTFCLVTFEISSTMRELIYVPPGMRKPSPKEMDDDLQRKFALITATQQHIEDKYLQSCDQTNPSVSVIRKTVDLCVGIMWLVTYRPIQRSAASPSPAKIDGPTALDQSVRVLELSLELEEIPSHRWLVTIYVQWHALAVALAELCVQTEGSLVQRAWKAVDAVFDRSADRVADSNSGLLWRPIKKLMRKAQLQRTSPGAGSTAMPRLTTHLEETQIAGDIPAQPPPPAPTTQPLQYDQGIADAFQAVPVEPLPVGTLDAGTNRFVWDPWTVGLTSTQPLGTDEPDPMAWANWEVFIQDFQRETDQMQM